MISLPTNSLRFILLSIVAVVILLAGLQPAPVKATMLKLNGPLIAQGNVDDFQISPNNQFVVYKADQRVDFNFEIYSVPLAGGTAVRLNREPLSGIFQGVRAYEITANSTRVVYSIPISTTSNSGTAAGLYSVPIDGSTGSTLLYQPATALEGVWDFRFSPDGTQVVFRTGPNANNLNLFSVPTDGSSNGVALNKPLVSGGGVNLLAISPDSARVVYIADQDTDNTFELYSVPITGTANAGIKLNPTLPANGDVGDPSWSWASQKLLISPNSQTVVYLAVQDATGTALFNVPITGVSGSTKLSQPVTAVPGSSNFSYFQITPDGANVIFTADQENSGRINLYRVPLTGPAASAVRLNNSTINSNSVGGFSLADNGARVAYYISNGGPSFTLNIYSVPTAGTDAQVVNIANDAKNFQLNPNGVRVVYSQNDTTLLSVPIAGPENAKIVIANYIFPASFYFAYRLSPDNSRVIYLSGTNGNPSYNELYSTPITISDTVKISGPMVANGQVPYYGKRLLSSDGQWVVYLAEQDTVGQVELYATSEGGILRNERLYLPLIRR